ncbi:hypothetical protein [Hymenobacter actinosclerus]|uniref:Uncharacterized protein n=1 Tax=Hymenobacter actinosclerus TaxID=82805 RepID=A0A1I0JA12_9BACT|nr:hypothetical protein [Hymenobacter actinosclerus]SEU06080.1 hypothetical protein SAMN04487998_3704 [Hymenobacter actinosclerus]
MAHPSGQLGHFLPYLLGRQLRAVFWPGAGEGRAATLLLSLIAVAYALALGYSLNHTAILSAGTLPMLLAGINTMLFVTVLLADFLPSYRAVQRPLPEPLPVSARLNAVTAFVLDLVSVRRGLLLLFVLVVLLVAPAFWRPLGLSLLVWLSAAAVSFNLRLLLSVGRWRHPLFWLNLLCLGAAAVWLSQEFDVTAGPLAYWAAVLAVGGPLLLWAAALYLVAPCFSARYMPDQAESSSAEGRWLGRLSPEWKMYLRRTRPALLTAVGFKVLMMGWSAYMVYDSGISSAKSVLYLPLLPVLSFTYVNNNLLGYLWTATTDELERLGLTGQLLRRYLRLAGTVVLVDCLLSAVLLLAVFPRSMWPLLGLLPLAGSALMALGIWGSFWKAKPIVKKIDFSTMRNNSSKLISICSVGLAAALYLMPWWWARVALALVVTLSALVPVRRILSNHGPTRRQLWHRLMHA